MIWSHFATMCSTWKTPNIKSLYIGILHHPCNMSPFDESNWHVSTNSVVFMFYMLHGDSQYQYRIAAYIQYDPVNLDIACSWIRIYLYCWSNKCNVIGNRFNVHDTQSGCRKPDLLMLPLSIHLLLSNHKLHFFSESNIINLKGSSWIIFCSTIYGWVSA